MMKNLTYALLLICISCSEVIAQVPVYVMPKPKPVSTGVAAVFWFLFILLLILAALGKVIQARSKGKEALKVFEEAEKKLNLEKWEKPYKPSILLWFIFPLGAIVQHFQVHKKNVYARVDRIMREEEKQKQLSKKNAAPVSDSIPAKKSSSVIVPVNIYCPNCKKKLSMRAEKFHGNIGKRIKCPTCNKGMTLSIDLLSK
jgi:hypothetical protein